MRASLLVVIAVAGVGLSCTDAGLYATSGDGPAGADRLEIQGKACVPIATGENFPVKVLFAVQGGVGVDRQTIGQISDAIQSVMDRFSSPYITFGFVAYHSVASGFQGKFVDATQMPTAIAKYAAYQEAGPISVRAPLKLANSLVSGDMQTGCRGQIARARYLVVLIIANPDDSCNNPVYNAGIDLRCAAMSTVSACTQCELARVTEDLKALATKYSAGEVSVQPVYVRTMADMLARQQAEAIARAGGTEVVEADPAGVKAALNGLNYASLQRSLKLKRLIAFNRNAVARDGVLFTDSDEDGVSDEDEDVIGTNKQAYDSDDDGLGDGVELKMGLKPQPGNQDVINSCNVTSDIDGDRLNDCEERVLGTDGCITDTDGDGLPDLVELYGGTNPLLPEDLDDDDRDGLSNVAEILAHTDPRSADLAFQTERGYGYSIKDAPPTDDGRACYDISAYNITLMPTLSRPKPFGTVLKGTNDVFLYFQVGRDNDPRGTGIGSVFAVPVQFLPPARKKIGALNLKGPVKVTPDEFVLGY